MRGRLELPRLLEKKEEEGGEAVLFGEGGEGETGHRKEGIAD